MWVATTILQCIEDDTDIQYIIRFMHLYKLEN